jgi:hypothetical protein
MRAEVLQLARSTYGVSNNCGRATGTTGEIAAGLAARSILWAWQLPQTLPANQICWLERLRLQWTCINAFTTAPTAGRSLSLVQLTQLPTGGHAGNTWSKAASGAFGSCVVATNAALTNGGNVPVASDVIATLSLAGYGSSGASIDKEFRFTGCETAMYELLAGAVIGITNINAMDPGGSFELVVEADVQQLPSNYPIP